MKIRIDQSYRIFYNSSGKILQEWERQFSSWRVTLVRERVKPDREQEDDRKVFLF